MTFTACVQNSLYADDKQTQTVTNIPWRLKLSQAKHLSFYKLRPATERPGRKELQSV